MTGHDGVARSVRRQCDRRAKGHHPPRCGDAARRDSCSRACQGRRDDCGAAVPPDDHVRHHRVRLLAAQDRNQSAPADAQAGRRRRDPGAPGGAGARQAADHARLHVRRRAGVGAMGHPRAEARRRGSRARHPAGAAARLRSQRPAHRLWRRLLRHDHRQVSRDETDRGRRHRLCGPGSRGGPGHRTRRPPRSRANGTGNDRFPRVA